MYLTGRFLLCLDRMPNCAGVRDCFFLAVRFEDLQAGRANDMSGTTKEFSMARYEFRFIVTDTELSEEHQRKVGQAVAEAGALALAGATPAHAVTVSYGINRWWIGLPPVEIYQALEEAAAQKAGRETPGEAL